MIIGFKQWLKESTINSMNVDSHEILTFQYAPEIQIHSGLDSIDKEYFKNIFSKGKITLSDLKKFIHSYVKNDPTGERHGARMVVYEDGRIVIGKAMNHVYLIYNPGSSGRKAEAHFDMNNKKITISNIEGENFYKLEVWKKIINNLKRARLINNNYKIVGCPPSCDTNEPGGTTLLVKDLLSQKGEIELDKTGRQLKSVKEKETESLVRNFLSNRAIGNRNSDFLGYMYRYGEWRD